MALDKTTWWFSDENKAITLKPWLYNPYPEIEKLKTALEKEEFWAYD